MTGSPEIAVLDTHALIWWLAGSTRKLGRRARGFVDAVDAGKATACIPTIVLVELGEAIQSGGVSLGMPFEQFVARLEAVPSRYNVVPLSAAIVTRAHSLFAIPERGDRLIAATAAELDLPLITRDPAIAKVGSVQAIW